MHTKLVFVEQVFGLLAVAFSTVVGKPTLNTSLTGSGCGTD
jgi:hypothetical protein